MESKIYEVIVVGAGVMGSSTAYFLSKGLGAGSVLLLEQFDRLHKRGSSHGESRIIRMTYPEDFNTSLMFDAYKFWSEIEAEAKTKVLTKTGGLCFALPNNPDIQLILKNMDKFSIPYNIFTSETIGQIFPTVKLPIDQIAVYNPEAGVLNATKAVGVLQNLAVSNGCEFQDNMPVSNIRIVKMPNGDDDGMTIETSSGQMFRAKKLVITAGAWTEKLIRDFNGLNLPLQPVQTTVAYWQVESPESYSAKNFPVFMTYNDDNSLVYGTPSLEYPNLIKCCGDEAANCDPDNRNFQPDWRSVMDDAGTFLKKVFTGVAEKPTKTESCMYTLSPDKQFIIDTLPGNPNVLIGCGFSGHGFKLGPVVGKILSQLAITGEHPYPHVHPHFTLGRFQL